MEKKQNVPALRFPGFSGEWKRKTLGEFGNVAMNRRIFKGETSETGEIPFYKIGTFGKEPDAYISRQLFEEYKAKYPYPDVGDILLSAAGSIGKTVEYTGKDEYFQDSNIVWLKHDERLDNPFLKYFYSKVKWGTLEGGTVKRLYNKILLETEIVLPEIIEQKKIGKFFASYDRMLAHQEGKIRKLQQFRQAMLTKLFPQDGVGKPELYFEGGLNCWKAFCLEDCAERLDNLRVPVSATNRIAGTTPYYGANGIQDYVSGYTHEGEFILIAEDGANDLDNYPIQYVNGKIWVNNHAHVLQGKTKIADTKFLKYALSQVNMRFYLVGGSRSKLNSNIMMNIELKLPIDINEQRKIGDFLGNLDRYISLQQKKLERMQRLKAALLEKMFV